MKVKTASLVSGALRILPFVLTVVFAAALLTHVLPGRVIPDRGGAEPGTKSPSEPWTDAQIAKPADFAKEMAGAKNRNRPVIVCTGIGCFMTAVMFPALSFTVPLRRGKGSMI